MSQICVSMKCCGAADVITRLFGRDEDKRQQHDELLLKVTLPSRFVDKEKQICICFVPIVLNLHSASQSR